MTRIVGDEDFFGIVAAGVGRGHSHTTHRNPGITQRESGPGADFLKSSVTEISVRKIRRRVVDDVDGVRIIEFDVSESGRRSCAEVECDGGCVIDVEDGGGVGWVEAELGAGEVL